MPWGLGSLLALMARLLGGFGRRLRPAMTGARGPGQGGGCAPHEGSVIGRWLRHPTENAPE